jgi:hypothetical protein
MVGSDPIEVFRVVTPCRISEEHAASTFIRNPEEGGSMFF